jgi:hypothetical protein
MNIANSFSFLVFGIIMRLLPVLAPTLVASDATSIAAAEATTRGIWLVMMGYFVGALGAWFFLKETTRRGAFAVAQLRQRIQLAREARALAQVRKAHVRALMDRVVVRVQY